MNETTNEINDDIKHDVADVMASETTTTTKNLFKDIIGSSDDGDDNNLKPIMRLGYFARFEYLMTDRRWEYEEVEVNPYKHQHMGGDSNSPAPPMPMIPGLTASPSLLAAADPGMTVIPKEIITHRWQTDDIDIYDTKCLGRNEEGYIINCPFEWLFRLLYLVFLDLSANGDEPITKFSIYKRSLLLSDEDREELKESNEGEGEENEAGENEDDAADSSEDVAADLERILAETKDKEEDADDVEDEVVSRATGESGNKDKETGDVDEGQYVEELIMRMSIDEYVYNCPFIAMNFKAIDVTHPVDGSVVREIGEDVFISGPWRGLIDTAKIEIERGLAMWEMGELPDEYAVKYVGLKFACPNAMNGEMDVEFLSPYEVEKIKEVEDDTSDTSDEGDDDGVNKQGWAVEILDRINKGDIGTGHGKNDSHPQERDGKDTWLGRIGKSITGGIKQVWKWMRRTDKK